jgi:hypothetical protein
MFPTSDAMGTDLTRRFFNAADRTKMLRKQKELDALAAQDKAFLAGEEQMDRLAAQDREFLANEAAMGVDDLSNYEGSGGSFAGDTSYKGSGGSFAGDTSYQGSGGSFAEAMPEIPKEDLDWFKKETGTAFNPNSVADVYYLMNRKYNKVSEAKADELERKRQKGSAATNLSRVQKMKNLMR